VYTGGVDVTIWTKSGAGARRMHLNEVGALPLLPNDQYRVEVKVSPAAYVYLFLIDDEGEANPMYPWVPGKWGTRPAQEEKIPDLSLPRNLKTGYTVPGGTSGMWTMLLLARETQWTATDAEVQGLFAGLPPQRPVQGSRSVVWFENGRVKTDDPVLRKVEFVEQKIDDPVLRLQALLRDRLQPQASFTSAISFAKQTKP
jgi:hypothetical protein